MKQTIQSDGHMSIGWTKVYFFYCAQRPRSLFRTVQLFFRLKVCTVQTTFLEQRQRATFTPSTLQFQTLPAVMSFLFLLSNSVLELATRLQFLERNLFQNNLWPYKVLKQLNYKVSPTAAGNKLSR